MQPVPPLPALSDSDDILDGGHLWIQEYVSGSPLRFQVQESGLVRFAGDVRTFGNDVPPHHAQAAREVQRRLDTDALRAAVGDVERVVFVGVSTHQRAIDYDWERLPAFLGTDVWRAGGADSDGTFLPPDRVEQVYERLGLEPVNTFQKEVRAVDFRPDRYEFPESAWYDGPAAGVVLRNKRGASAKLLNEAVRTRERSTVDATPEAHAERLFTPDLLERAVSAGDDEARSTSAAIDRVVDAIYREHAAELDLTDPDEHRAFRSAVATRVSQHHG